MIVEEELVKLKKFQSYLRVEDKLIFDDLIVQCKTYAPYASTMVYTIKEVPLLISMLFGQHKKIVALEKKVQTLETVLKKNQPANRSIDTQQTPTTNPAAAEGSFSQPYGPEVFEPADSAVT